MAEDNSEIKQIEDGLAWLFGEEDMPRYRADWMTGSDDLILEFLEDSGAAHNKRGLENNFKDRGLGVSYTTLNRRLPQLREAGLIKIIPGEGKYYKITEKGEKYLSGEIDLRSEDEPSQ